MDESRGQWVIALSFSVAYLLAIYPLPRWAEWARPEWVALVLIYWVIALPQRVGIGTAFAAGLLLDVFEGAVLGQNALSLSVLAWFSLLVHQRLRVFNLWQQALSVFLMLGVHQILCQWIQNMAGAGAPDLWFLVSAVSGAALWPGVLLVLRHQRRTYHVQ